MAEAGERKPQDAALEALVLAYILLATLCGAVLAFRYKALVIYPAILCACQPITGEVQDRRRGIVLQ